MKNLNAQTIGIGILLAALAVSCSPVVKVKDPSIVKTGDATKTADAAGKVAAVGDGVINTVGDKKEDAASVKDGAAAVSDVDAKAALDKQSLSDPALNNYIISLAKNLNADCVKGRRSVEKTCDADGCDTSLNITCIGQEMTDEELKAATQKSTQDALALAGAVIGASLVPGGAGAVAAGALVAGAASQTAVAAASSPTPTATPGASPAAPSDQQVFYRINVKGSIDYAKKTSSWSTATSTTTKILVKSGDWQAAAN